MHGSGVMRIVDKGLSVQRPEVPDALVCEKIDKASESLMGNLMEVFSAEIGWSILSAIYPSSQVGIRGEVDCGSDIEGGREERKARARSLLNGISARVVTRDDSDFVSFSVLCPDISRARALDTLEYCDFAFWSEVDEHYDRWSGAADIVEPLTSLVAIGRGANLIPLCWEGSFSAHGLFLADESDASKLALTLRQSDFLVVPEPIVLTEQILLGRFNNIWELILGA